MIHIDSVLESKVVDEVAMIQEDFEANAFAGFLLMPDRLMREQIGLLWINDVDVRVDDILTLYGSFCTFV